MFPGTLSSLTTGRVSLQPLKPGCIASHRAHPQQPGVCSFPLKPCNSDKAKEEACPCARATTIPR